MEYPGYTAFECPNEPVFLLSRTCSNAYYGADGPCCKVDDGLNFVTNLATDLFPEVRVGIINPVALLCWVVITIMTHSIGTVNLLKKLKFYIIPSVLVGTSYCIFYSYSMTFCIV